MTTIIPPGFANLSLVHSSSGTSRPQVCSIGLGDSIFDLALLADIAAAWTDGPLSDMASSSRFEKAVLKEGPNSTGLTIEYVSGDTGGNTVGGSPSVAWLVTKVTAKGGRSGKGRMYVPGMPEAVCDPGGNLVGTEPADMQAQFDEFLAALGALGVTPYLLHSDSSDPDEILSFSVQPLAATQRRRLRK